MRESATTLAPPHATDVGRAFGRGMRALCHPIVAAVLVTLATVAFGWFQNRGGIVGGPISVPKVLWLNYTLPCFVVLPLMIGASNAFSKSVKTLFRVVFAGFALRGVIEFYLLYMVRGWECIYGISHDFATAAFIVAYRFPVAQVSNLLYRRFPIGRASKTSSAARFAERLQAGSLRNSKLEPCATGEVRQSDGPPALQSSSDRAATTFSTIVVVSLCVEAWMAWKFSTLASPSDGIYFAADDPHFRVVNTASWVAVSIGYPCLIYSLWRTRRAFPWYENKASLQPSVAGQ